VIVHVPFLAESTFPFHGSALLILPPLAFRKLGGEFLLIFPSIRFGEGIPFFLGVLTSSELVSRTGILSGALLILAFILPSFVEIPNVSSLAVLTTAGDHCAVAQIFGAYGVTKVG